MLELMAAGKLTYKPLLTDVVPLGTATDTYERVNNCPDEVMTVAFNWQ